MKLILFFIFVVVEIILCSQQSPYNEAVTLLKTMVEKRKANSIKPENIEKIISNIQTSSDVQIKFFKITDLNELLNEMELPSNIINEIKSVIVFPVMNEFKEFNFKLESSVAILEDYSGILGIFGDDALIILFHTNAVGNLVAVYETIKSQNCYSILCFDHCYDYSYEQPRNYTLKEIYSVNKILQEKALDELAKTINTLPNDSNNFSLYKSQNFEENDFSLKNSMKNFPNDIFISMSVNKNLKKKIFHNLPNIVNFEPNAIVHQILGLKNKYFELFANNLFFLIGLPKNFKKYFLNVFEKYPQGKDRSLRFLSVIYSTNNDTQCKYFSVIMKHDWNLGTTDIMIANFQQVFLLAPRTIIFAEKMSDSYGDFDFSKFKIKIHKKLTYIENSQVLNILDGFELMSLKSFANFFNNKRRDDISINSLAVHGQEQKMTGLLDQQLQNLENVVKKFKEIVSIFKFTSKSEFSKMIEKKGYSFFAANGIFHKGMGLPKTKLPDFTDYILKWLNISNIEANEQLKSKIQIFIKIISIS